MTDTEIGEDRAGKRFLRMTTSHIEFLATVLLAAAAVLTAWAAFQSSQWGTQQSRNYSEASAIRTQSALSATTAGQFLQIDVNLFLDWLAAVYTDSNAGVIPPIGQGEDYRPTPGTLSGFLYERTRDELRPALDSWLATEPLTNPDAPPVPFSMPEYVLADGEYSVELAARAEQLAADAVHASRISSDYVLTTVLFAAALFFAALSSKIADIRYRVVTLGLSAVILTGTAVFLVVLPIHSASLG